MEKNYWRDNYMKLIEENGEQRERIRKLLIRNAELRMQNNELKSNNRGDVVIIVKKKGVDIYE